MFSTRIGILQYAAGLVVFILIALVILKNTSYSIMQNAEFISLWLKDKAERTPPPHSQLKVRPCSVKSCPAGTFSFSLSSGAANVVAPKICIENELVLGSGSNAGPGINTVVLNGKTGKVAVVQTFNVLDGEVKPLIEFLQGLKKGNIVLMASYDDPATKLTDKARSLIEKLGSSSIKSLGHRDRDNWVLVGRQGGVRKRPFEKHIKNNKETNKYDAWPEILQMEGCIPLSHK